MLKNWRRSVLCWNYYHTPVFNDVHFRFGLLLNESVAPHTLYTKTHGFVIFVFHNQTSSVGNLANIFEITWWFVDETLIAWYYFGTRCVFVSCSLSLYLNMFKSIPACIWNCASWIVRKRNWFINSELFPVLKHTYTYRHIHTHKYFFSFVTLSFKTDSRFNMNIKYCWIVGY